MLAMVAVGLWASQLGRPAIWMLPVVFPAMMALGAALGTWRRRGAVGRDRNSRSRWSCWAPRWRSAFRLPLAVSAVLVGLFAVFHGYAHGSELPAAAFGAAVRLGFVAATLVLHGIGIGLG